MTGRNHYQTLEIDPAATQAEIKSAYRRLAKRFHPDSHHQMANHERIAQVNEAYAILKDPHRRLAYDQNRTPSPRANAGKHTRSSASRSQAYGQPAHTARATEIHFQQWLKCVYVPVNQQMANILNPLAAEIQCLSADPYDDDLMADFQDYLADCRTRLESAQSIFQSYPNPSNIASIAAHLYYCLNHIEDGIEELERFTYCYDDSYLTTGRELFRLSKKLRSEAQTALKSVM